MNKALEKEVRHLYSYYSFLKPLNCSNLLKFQLNSDCTYVVYMYLYEPT